MDSFLDSLDDAFPIIHCLIFVIGVSSNAGLIIASIKRTPRALQSYAIMITIGSCNDLISVCTDFFTQQRMLVVPGNLLYLSLGPCNLISPRACYLGYCLQLGTLAYSFFIIVGSFGYRLWILYREPPSMRTMLILMAALCIIPAGVGSTFTAAQAEDSIVRSFLQANAPDYLHEEGALTGHSGFTPHLVFTILIMIGLPWPLYVVILCFRFKILSKLRAYSTEMSERTRSMHKNLVRALTIHAMLPPIYFIGVSMYLVLYFDIYRHPALEKAIYTVNAFPTALAAFCTIYYVEPYRRFLSFKNPLTPSKTSVSITQAMTAVTAPPVCTQNRKASTRSTETFEISVACKAPQDLAMWKFCLANAIAKFSIPFDYMTTYSRCVSATMDCANFESMIAFVDPLIRRTKFAKQKLDPTMAPLQDGTGDVAMERLQQQIDAIVDQRRDISDQLHSHWTELKTNTSKSIDVDSFKIKPFSQCLESFIIGRRKTGIGNLKMEFEWCLASNLEGLVTMDSMLENGAHYATNSGHMVSNNSLREQAYNMHVTIDKKHLQRLLDHLKPLSIKMRFESIEFEQIQSKVMHDCWQFCSATTVEKLILNPNTAVGVEFKLCLDFFRKVRPLKVTYKRLGIANEMFDFLFPLADVVESIKIGEERRNITHTSLTPIPLTEEAVKIVKVFHHIGKKGCLIMPSEAAPINAQIGEYKERTIESQDFPDRQMILISHVELDHYN